MIGTFKQKAINHLTQSMSPILVKVFPDFWARQVKNPIFLVGSFRSGTTLLAGLLGMHRDIANWTEANKVLDPQWYPWRPANRKLAPLEYDPVAFTKRWWNDNEARQRDIQATFGAYQWLQRKPYFLNKSPYNIFRIPYLLKMFPKARFIHIARDGRAVAYSHAIKLTKDKLPEWPVPQRELFSESFDELAVWISSFWKATMEEMAYQDKAMRLTNAGILLSLTYEELCTDTAGTLDRVCQYINVDPSRFLDAIKQESIIAQNYKWKENLEEEVVRRMEMAMEPLLTQNGYL